MAETIGGASRAYAGRLRPATERAETAAAGHITATRIGRLKYARLTR
jgi:hypothetical protein